MTWRLPGYTIDKLLGSGGYGEVWGARVTATGEPVALKRVPTASAAQVAAARTEAAMLSALDHPHLIRLHALVAVPDYSVLVLDLADGGSLADLLVRRGRLTAGEVVTALAPIGAALAYAHASGVVHGDVTAANVLFTGFGLPLLADLGVARIVGDEAPVRCTAAYLDPAVAIGSLPAAASDVFMLAAVAVHALGGSPLWDAPSVGEAVAQAARGEIGDLGARLPGVAPAVVDVLARALQVEPFRRCTAAEFALDLRQAATPLPVELAAGARARVPALRGPRHAAPVAAREGRQPRPGRPAFARPGSEPAPPTQSAELTQGVRIGPRPTLPRPRRRPWKGGRVPAMVAALVGLIVLGSALAIGRRTSTTQGTRATAPASPSAPAVQRDVAAVLIRLDATRERAFAEHAPALLAEVYLPGPLLDQDRALLARITPAGCRLIGVHTTFSDVESVAAPTGRIAVTVRASMAPSTLRCADRPAASAAALGPTLLRVELAPLGNDLRIAAQQRVA